MKVFGFYGTSVRVIMHTFYAIRVDKLFLQNVAFLIHHPESCILNDLSGNTYSQVLYFHDRRPIRNDHGAIYQAACVTATSGNSWHELLSGLDCGFLCGNHFDDASEKG